MRVAGPPLRDAHIDGLTRRRFLNWSALAVGLAFSSSLCSAEADSMRPPPGPDDALFTLGVASGDPLPDGVVLWTRLAVDPMARGGGMCGVPVNVDWEVATDETMRRVIRRGTTIATADGGHSVHIDLRGLQPSTEYFYRFRALGDISVIGRTRTAPAASAQPRLLTVAVASCQNWGEGYFVAYRDLAAHAPDVVFHLGDYIYETPPPARGPRRGDPRPRSAFRAATSIDDYRDRYALYRADADLQEAHRVSPFIMGFDDHEVADNWAGDVPADGTAMRDFVIRRAAGLRAWWENTPTRISARRPGVDMRAYRRFTFGDLAQFHLLDTRSHRSDQVNGDRDTAQDARTADPTRTMLGSAQEQWLLDGLAQPRRRWNVIAQQLPMADLARLDGTTRAVSMDGWSGYEPARTRILDGAHRRDVTGLVSLAGDIHRSVVADLRSDYRTESPVVGVELAGTSISSGGDGEDSDDNDRRLKAASPHVRFGNAQRGYLLNRVRPDRWECEMRVTDTVADPGARLYRRALITIPTRRSDVDVV